MTNHQRVGEALHILTAVLAPFVARKLRAKKRGTDVRYASTDRRVGPSGTPGNRPKAERRTGKILSIDGRAAMFLNYPAVSASGGNVLFPAHEGRLSGGHAIDRHGDPDLMAAFSAEYLKQYWAIVPKGRLPRTMTEMMPALHLLVNAAELALKADLIRSEIPSRSHVLRALHGELEDAHRQEIEKRFADTAPNTELKVLGADSPTVESVPGVYEESFGGGTVYQDTRYFAEPTTMLRSRSLKGGTLVKDTPYPIFLPVVVQTMLDVYTFFSGSERLKRLGADVSHGSRDPGNDQHGDWGLVPSSAGLVVIRVAQHVAWDEYLQDRDDFSRLGIFSLLARQLGLRDAARSWLRAHGYSAPLRLNPLPPRTEEVPIASQQVQNTLVEGAASLHRRQ